MPARPVNPWLIVHAVYAGGILVFFAVFQVFMQNPLTGSDWGRYAVEVAVKTAFLHTVFWIMLIRPAAAAYRRVLSDFPGDAQRDRLRYEVTPVAVLDKRFQRVEEELKRRAEERRD